MVGFCLDWTSDSIALVLLVPRQNSLKYDSLGFAFRAVSPSEELVPPVLLAATYPIVPHSEDRGNLQSPSPSATFRTLGPWMRG